MSRPVPLQIPIVGFRQLRAVMNPGLPDTAARSTPVLWRTRGDVRLKIPTEIDLRANPQAETSVAASAPCSTTEDPDAAGAMLFTDPPADEAHEPVPTLQTATQREYTKAKSELDKEQKRRAQAELEQAALEEIVENAKKASVGFVSQPAGDPSRRDRSTDQNEPQISLYSPGTGSGGTSIFSS